MRVEEQMVNANFYSEHLKYSHLTRPGQVRYKFAAGRPSDSNHRVNGDSFASGEYSWGLIMVGPYMAV